MGRVLFGFNGAGAPEATFDIFRLSDAGTHRTAAPLVAPTSKMSGAALAHTWTVLAGGVAGFKTRIELTVHPAAGQTFVTSHGIYHVRRLND